MAELQRRAKEELAKRRSTPGFKEAVIAALKAPARRTLAGKLEGLFDRQLLVLNDCSPRIALCCSRRAGKSELAARMIAISLLESGHNEYTLFAARTLARARQILWPLLSKINDDYGLGWRMSEHIGQIVTPDGAVFILLGVDDTTAAEKVRGSKYRLAVCDESATYENLLERLVIDCLEPGTIDFEPQGRIVLCGTPGYNRSGYWHAVATGQKPGWSHYHWTLQDNPFIANADAALAKIREGNGWSIDEPVYRREYLGQWVADESTLVYAAAEGRNTITLAALMALHPPPPGMSFEHWVRELWLTTVAADIGYTDAFAVSCMGSPPGCQDMFILESYKQEGILAGEQADHIRRFREKYRPLRVVVDAGGQGKLVHAEYNARYGKQAGGLAIPAKKQGKTEAIGLFNSDMRMGRVKAVVPVAADVYAEWVELPWADDEKTLIHPSYKNHSSDTVLYAWREHRSFLTKPLALPATEADREREAMERRVKAAKRRK